MASKERVKEAAKLAAIKAAAYVAYLRAGDVYLIELQKILEDSLDALRDSLRGLDPVENATYRNAAWRRRPRWAYPR